jgi:hypothetical protein
LQVLGPHDTLSAGFSMVQICCEHVPPGGVQMPQLALQQT